MSLKDDFKIDSSHSAGEIAGVFIVMSCFAYPLLFVCWVIYNAIGV